MEPAPQRGSQLLDVWGFGQKVIYAAVQTLLFIFLKGVGGQTSVVKATQTSAEQSARYVDLSASASI